MANRSRITQELANAFPFESAARTDEQSYAQSVLNVFGNQLEPLVKIVRELGDGRFLDTANVSTLGVMHRVALSPSFDFDTDETDPSHVEFVEPTVTATVSGTTTVTVTTPAENTLRSLSQSPPTRIALNTTTSGLTQMYSGLVGATFDSTAVTDPVTPNQLTIDMSGGTRYVRIEDPNQVKRGHIRITGKTDWDLTIVEPVMILHDGARTTIHEFTTADEISAVDIIPLDEATVTIRDHDFNQTEYEDWWQTEQGTNRREKSVFWKLDYSSPRSTLRKQTYIAPELADRINGRELDLYTEKSLILRDEDDADIHLLDIAFKPYTDLMYAVSADTLYVYEFGTPVIQHTSLGKKRETPDRLAILEINNEWPDIGEQIDISTYFSRPINTITKHRISVRHPDSTASGILDGTFYAHTEDFWDTTVINDRKLRGLETFTPTEAGDYVFTLECRYKDGRVDFDQRVVRVATLTPVATFSLSGVIPPGTTAVGVDFDSRHRLRVLLSSGRRAILDVFHDYMIVDYVQKVLYFAEDYQKVRVIP